MMIAVSAKSKNLESPIEQRFGRARWFLIYNLDDSTYDFIENVKQLNTPHGAGIQTAGALCSGGVKAVVTGHMGPKAFKVLMTAGVDIYLKQGGTVQEAVDNFREGKIKKLHAPDVEGSMAVRASA